MRNLLLIIIIWISCCFPAYADVPKIDLSVSDVNSMQWPVEFKLAVIVPKGYHAYLDKGRDNLYIPIAIDAKKKLADLGLEINNRQAPSGEYDNHVKATVLRGTGNYNLIVGLTNPNQPTSASDISVDVNYQLCSEIDHVCFRPQLAEFSLKLPVVSKYEIRYEPPPGLMEQLLQLFKNNQNNAFITFGLMLLAGMLSVATPCVYPMLPITSMFIINRANGIAKQEKLHAFVYLIGIVGTYMLLGLIAGMTGGAFNILMQSAWVNLGFAIFFAFFAIALLGFYELSFMQNEVHSLDQQSARVQGLTGTWLMGSVAGLVISPCVGPIVFALLLQVADNIALKTEALVAINQTIAFSDHLAIAAQGSLMMAGFGTGVGLPFFIVSVIKFKSLPKAGYWMNKIKYAFGFMILYFAYTYFAKSMGILGVDSKTTVALAFGMMAIWIAVIHCNVLSLLPLDATANQKMLRFCGVIAIITGAWLIIVGLGHTPIIQTAEAERMTTHLAPVDLMVEEDAGIAWYRNFAAAQKIALQTGKPIFIDFYAAWCANCIAFREEAANNPQLHKALRDNAITVKLIDNEPDFEQFRANPEHRQLKIGLPYFAVLAADGKLIWSSTDYKATQPMINALAHPVTDSQQLY